MGLFLHAGFVSPEAVGRGWGELLRGLNRVNFLPWHLTSRDSIRKEEERRREHPRSLEPRAYSGKFHQKSFEQRPEENEGQKGCSQKERAKCVTSVSRHSKASWLEEPERDVASHMVG